MQRPERIQAASESVTTRLTRALSSYTGQSTGQVDAKLKQAMYVMHPLTAYVVGHRANDFASSEMFLYRGSLENPEVFEGELAESLLNTLQGPSLSQFDTLSRLYWLWQTYGEMYLALDSDPTGSFGLAYHLASPLAVRAGTNPLSGKQALGIRLAHRVPERWFDIEILPDGRQQCMARRMWRPSAIGLSDVAENPRQNLASHYELYYKLFDGDVSAALNMALNNGLVWFYSDSTFDLGDGSFGDSPVDFEEEGESGHSQDATLDGDAARAQRQMDELVKMMGMSMPSSAQSLATSTLSPQETYLAAQEALWKNPETALRRMSIPVTGPKAPEWIPIGRAFSPDTMERQSRLEREIARGLDVPAGWALSFISEAPANSEAATLRDSAEYKAALESDCRRIGADLSNAWIRPLARTLRVRDADSLKVGFRLSSATNAVALSSNVKWAWEAGFPVARQQVASVLGLQLAEGEEYAEAVLRLATRTQSGNRIAASMDRVIDMSPSDIRSIAHLDRPR